MSQDFLGDEYHAILSLRCEGRPRLSMPALPISLTWDSDQETFKSMINGQVKMSLSHVLDGPELANLLSWWQQLRDAFAAVQPALEQQLASANRWLAEERAKVGQLRASLREQQDLTGRAAAACGAEREASAQAAALLQTELESERLALANFRAQAAELTATLESVARAMAEAHQPPTGTGAAADPVLTLEQAVSLVQQARLLCPPPSEGLAAVSTAAAPDELVTAAAAGAGGAVIAIKAAPLAVAAAAPLAVAAAPFVAAVGVGFAGAAVASAIAEAEAEVPAPSWREAAGRTEGSDGYALGDGTRAAVTSAGRALGAGDDYRFGDGTRAALRWFRGQ